MCAKSLPLVSVIVPVYNGCRYLAEALGSIFHQRYEPVEIIMVDDGSTDGSAEVAKSFGSQITYIFQENQGTAAARNLGVETAKGSLLAFLDQDDVWLENKLHRQVRTMIELPEVQVVFGYVEQFCSPDMAGEFQRRFCFDPSPVPGFLPSVMLIRREAFERVGPFRTDWQLGEWAHWYSRYQELGLRTEMLRETMARRRLHDQNKGLVLRKFRREYLEIVRSALHRRRTRSRDDVFRQVGIKP